MRLVRSRMALLGVVLVALAVVSGCSGNSDNEGDATPAPTSTTSGGPGATPTLFGIRGEAPVDSVELKKSGTSPVQVQAVVRGNLPDGCTKMENVSQKREGNTFTVTLGTFKQPNVMCIQVLTAYIQNIDLDTSGLKAGTYTVKVDNVSRQFTLDADNPAK